MSNHLTLGFPGHGISFDAPANWRFDKRTQLMAPPGKVKHGVNNKICVVRGISIEFEELGERLPGQAIRDAQAHFLKRNSHLKQDGERRFGYSGDFVIVRTRFAHSRNAIGDKKENVAWAAVGLRSDRDLPRWVPDGIYHFILSGPDRNYPDLERKFESVLISLRIATRVDTTSITDYSATSELSVVRRW